MVPLVLTHSHIFDGGGGTFPAKPSARLPQQPMQLVRQRPQLRLRVPWARESHGLAKFSFVCKVSRKQREVPLDVQAPAKGGGQPRCWLTVFAFELAMVFNSFPSFATTQLNPAKEVQFLRPHMCDIETT